MNKITKRNVKKRNIYLVYGKHLLHGKEYCWQIPKSNHYLQETVSVGDTLFVETKQGQRPIFVTRVEKVKSLPKISYVKNVVLRASHKYKFKQDQLHQITDKIKPLNYNLGGVLFNDDNEVIAYYNGKAIVKDDNGDIFYTILPELYAIAGEKIEERFLTPLKELPINEYLEIMLYVNDCERG